MAEKGVIMILDTINKYTNDHFIFRDSDRLVDVCNALNTSSGFYIIYAYENGEYNLIYIGISGRMNNQGIFQHRIGGIKDRFLKGKQFGERRQVAWSKNMRLEKIEHLKIHWYITYDDTLKDVPRDIEEKLLKEYYTLNGILPRWNKRF